LASAAAPIRVPGVYLVKPGETLERIARKAYGDSKMWTLIFDANEQAITNSSSADLAGQKLWIPKKDGSK
jgi:nucleoid-associated protein YgaU